MKVIIVLFHTLFAFSMLLSFPTVESWLGRVYSVGKRLNMTQNDPLMIPTQSKLAKKDDGISVKVADEKDSLTDVASKGQAKTIKQGNYLLIKLLNQSYKKKRIDTQSRRCCCRGICERPCEGCIG